MYIIGAGCSRNYTEGTARVPGLMSPLDKDFFAMAKKVILQRKVDPTLSMTLDSVIFYMSRLYGRVPPEISIDRPTRLDEEGLRILDDPNLSLENVMTAFSLEKELFIKPPCFLGHKEPSPFFDELAPLIELVAVTISEALLGPPCSKHRKLAESLVAGDIVISYNYDMLMDNALRNCGKLSDSGYLLSFQKVSSGRVWERPDEGTSEITLFKLHGSLNWMRCTNCDSNLMMRYEKMDHWETSIPETCPKCGEHGSYLERLLVPPLLTKDYSDHAINYLWREASRLIQRHVHEIVAIGYSLPGTDFASETLLRTALGFNRQKETPLTLVNPDKEVIDRYSKIFAPGKIKWIKTIEEYLDNL